MAAKRLVPGYRQVDAFGCEEDYVEEEEEVSYVTLDLGVVEPTLLPSSSTYRLIGLDTPTPFLQLSGSIFKGRHDTLLGTELLFTEDKNDAQPNKRSLTHVGCTEQRIRFKEVQLKEKTRAPPERQSPDLLEQVATIYTDATEHPSTKSSRKKKKGSRKGKERVVDEEEDVMMDVSTG